MQCSIIQDIYYQLTGGVHLLPIYIYIYIYIYIFICSLVVYKVSVLDDGGLVGVVVLKASMID